MSTDHYIRGTVIVSSAALDHLAENGVKPPRCPYYDRTPRDGAACSSFYIPALIAGHFEYRTGNPATPGRLDLGTF